MVCPVNPKRIKPDVRQEDAVPAGDPDEMGNLMEALRSPDPAVRREAARMMEVSSLGALNAAQTWLEERSE